MEHITIILLIICYLVTLAWALKEAYHEKMRADHLAMSNRELHAENDYMRKRNTELIELKYKN